MWVSLDPTVGSEIRKTRPAVIVSNDSCNTYGSRVVVLPLTSNMETSYPGEAVVQIKGQPARALGDQIRSIDKSRVRGSIGRLTTEEMTAVDEAIVITLGLTGYVL